MAQPVLLRQWCGRIIVDEDEVGRSAFCDLAQRQAEELAGDARIMAEQGGGGGLKARRGIAVQEVLAPEGSAHLGTHAGGHGVGAQARQDPLFMEPGEIGDADRIIEIGLGIVDQGCAGGGQQLHLALTEVDAVGGDRSGSEYALAVQPFNHALPVMTHCVLLVHCILGGVDVKAAAEIVAEGGRSRQGLVAEGEGGVQPEHRRDAGIVALPAGADKGGVLLQPRAGRSGAVAVGNFVAEAAAQAGCMESPGDGLERAADRAGTGVMIDQGGGAAADCLQQDREGAPVAVLEGEGLVEPPPEILQHRLERLRRRGFGQPARKGAVAVGVGVDQAGHENFSGCVDDPGAEQAAGSDCRLLSDGTSGAECFGGCDGLYRSRLDEEGVVVEHPVRIAR